MLAAPALVTLLLALLLLPAAPASAHPLDVYLQSTYLTVATDEVDVELDLTFGVLVAPAVLAELDADGDATITQAEGVAYARRALAGVALSVDGRTAPVAFSSVEVPTYLAAQAGYGTLRVRGTAAVASSSGAHDLFYRNGFAPSGSRYQVNAVVDPAGGVVLGTQTRSADQQQTTVAYSVGASAPATSSTSSSPSASSTAGTSRLARVLSSGPLPATALLLALGLAAVLGALHALTPGHGKTLMAAYLVGTGGTVTDAMTLGAVVTVTHTASVVLIGLGALVASSLVVPDVLVPALEVTSGVLVAGLGLRLLWQRRGLLRRRPVMAHVHSHNGPDGDHEHDHSHDHPHEHTHSHGGRPHTHALPTGPVTARSLVALGVSGGLVPCPEALGVLVLSVGLGRIALGMGLILAFSAGLATVLVGIGVLLVRSRTVLARSERLTSWRAAALLPLVSAVVVTLLGVGLLARAAVSVA